jgi:hypothetical protein
MRLQFFKVWFEVGKSIGFATRPIRLVIAVSRLIPNGFGTVAEQM